MAGIFRARASRERFLSGPGDEDAVAEARMRPDIDGHAGVSDAADQLLLPIGAALAEDAQRAQGLGALLGGRALEHGREVVRDDDHAVFAENTAWAEDTPAPGSLRWPRSRSVSSRAESVGSTYIGFAVIPM